MRDIVDYARALVEAGCSPHQPTHIHRHLGPDKLQVLCSALQRDYGGSHETARLWRSLFEAVGLRSGAIARDRLVLRFQPPHADGAAPWSGRGIATVGFHRDSWATNLYAQVNWWAPVYPLSPRRTVAMYPHLWTVPLPNTSSTFDMADAMRRVRNGTAGRARDIVPELLPGVDLGEPVPVVIDPGSVMAFSGQHAHAAVPNHTDITRISVETRTLCIADHVGRHGAPNVDGDAHWMAPGLFRRVSDGKSLPELLGTRSLEPFDGLRG